MKYAQITDTHVNDFMSNSNNVDGLERLKVIISDIKNRKINSVILTGDYGEPEDFDNIIELLKSNSLDYEYILGDHDELEIYNRREEVINKVKVDGLYYSSIREDTLYMFLDTRLDMVEQGQLDFIDSTLNISTHKRVVIFSHHPIFDCGNTTMDRLYPLNNREKVSNILKKYNNQITIFTGHYHNNYCIKEGNITQYVTMSSLMQVEKFTEKIVLDSHEFGYRIIDIGKDIKTEIVSFTGV